MIFIKQFLKRLFLTEDASFLYYKSMSLYKKGGLSRYYSYVVNDKIQRCYASSLSPKAQVGERLVFKHPFSIVIGDGVKIGSDVTIYQSVTLGAARIGEGRKGLYPTIGDRVVVFAGAVIVGGVEIGDDAVVGANAVVTSNVQPGAVVGGVPAKVISKK